MLHLIAVIIGIALGLAMMHDFMLFFFSIPQKNKERKKY